MQTQEGKESDPNNALADTLMTRWPTLLMRRPTHRQKQEKRVHHLITRHILPGTVIYSDQFSLYIPLNQLGYIHLSVNHSLTCEHSCSLTGCFGYTTVKHPKTELERLFVGHCHFRTQTAHSEIVLLVQIQ